MSILECNSPQEERPRITTVIVATLSKIESCRHQNSDAEHKKSRVIGPTRRLSLCGWEPIPRFAGPEPGRLVRAFRWIIAQSTGTSLAWGRRLGDTVALSEAHGAFELVSRVHGSSVQSRPRFEPNADFADRFCEISLAVRELVADKRVGSSNPLTRTKLCVTSTHSESWYRRSKASPHRSAVR